MPADLKQIFEVENVASILDDEKLAEISQNAVNGYESDESSREEWKKRNKEGMKLAMQLAAGKDFPFEGSANVMYPLISISSIQFASRAYPNLIPGWDIVRGKVIGKDEGNLKASKAARVETHMNYQLNEEMTEWEEETDRLLTVIPIMGCCFKETYFSKNQKRNVSLYCSPNDVVMHYDAKSMDTVPRITKRYNLYPNEIIERQRAKMFIEFEVGQAQKTKEENEEYSGNDTFKPHLFLQQHTWLDLDGDGYAEPYVLNIHYDTKKVVRIVPRYKLSDIQFDDRNRIQRIEARQHYTKFTFLHSPDGSIYDWGFGSLLGPINHTVNTTINQLLDSGTWNNTQAGFLGRNISLGRGKAQGELKFQPNEWKQVAYSGEDLRKNIVPLNEFMKEPSSVLFNLLGFMVNAGEKLSSVTELMMGEQTIQNEPATTSLARIEQGLKVFSSIHKRLHKSFGKEFKLLYELNAEYLQPANYYRILDEPETERVAMRDDYDKSSCDIIPTATPEDISNAQKMVKAQILYSLKGQGFNDGEINKRFIEAMQFPDAQTILQSPGPPPPDPKLVLEAEKLDLERSKFEFEMMKYGMEMGKIQSEIIKNLATAEAAEVGPQLEQYKAQMQALVSMATKNQTAKTGGNGSATNQ
jgi:chaperonin GroES